MAGAGGGGQSTEHRTQNTDGGRGKQKWKKFATMPVKISGILAFLGEG